MAMTGEDLDLYNIDNDNDNDDNEGIFAANSVHSIRSRGSKYNNNVIGFEDVLDPQNDGDASLYQLSDNENDDFRMKEIERLHDTQRRISKQTNRVSPQEELDDYPQTNANYRDEDEEELHVMTDDEKAILQMKKEELENIHEDDELSSPVNHKKNNRYAKTSKLEEVTEDEDNQFYNNREEEEEFDEEAYDTFIKNNEEYFAGEENQGENDDVGAKKPRPAVIDRNLECTKPRFKVGGRQLSLAEAKLFGLLDKNNQFINVKQTKEWKERTVLKMKPKKEVLTHVFNIAEPRNAMNEILQEEHTEKFSFVPQRSEEAKRAMKNPRCGYDFMDRLNSGGDFMSRLYKKASNKIPKSQLDQMKQDYEVRLDKLQCPSCLKPQSFDEFLEKRRICTLCNLKFEKLNITSGMTFLKKVQAKEEERLKKLREVEKSVYGENSKSVLVNKIRGPDVPSSSGVTKKPEPVKPKARPSSALTYRAPTEQIMKATQEFTQGTKRRPQSGKADINNKSKPVRENGISLSAGFNTGEAVEKLIKINNQKAANLEQAWENINGGNQKSLPNIQNHSNTRRSSAEPKRVTNPTLEKMQRLIVK